MTTGLHRQSELTIKEPFRVMFNQEKGKQFLEVVGLGESFQPVEAEEAETESEGGVKEVEVIDAGSSRLV